MGDSTAIAAAFIFGNILGIVYTIKFDNTTKDTNSFDKDIDSLALEKQSSSYFI